MEIKAALGQARKSQEAQFAKDWQDRLKQLKAEEVCDCMMTPFVLCVFALLLPIHAVEVHTAQHQKVVLNVVTLQDHHHKILVSPPF